MATVLGAAAALDSIGRLAGNVGVPAAIALLVLWQITPKLDAIALEQRQANTQLTVIGSACLSPRQAAFSTPGFP